jgi:tetratricopeptide (TPR) repeat protein
MSRRRQEELPEPNELQALLPPLDDGPGPAQPLSQSAQAALIKNALRAASPTPTGLGLRRGFLFGGAAMAASSAAYFLSRRFLGKSPSPQAPEPMPIAPSPRDAAAAPARDLGVAADAAAESGATDGESVAAARPRSVRPREHSSDDLLKLANERRRQKRFAEAVRLYLQIVEKYPRSDEAYVARIAAAGLLLERQKEPRAALRLFLAALRERPQGALAEEARLGLCDALHALSDRAAEERALRDFLAHHADSPARARIEARLRLLTDKKTP